MAMPCLVMNFLSIFAHRTLLPLDNVTNPLTSSSRTLREIDWKCFDQRRCEAATDGERLAFITKVLYKRNAGNFSDRRRVLFNQSKGARTQNFSHSIVATRSPIKKTFK